MVTPLGCPRCHNEKMNEKTVDIKLPTGQLEITRYTCTNCKTKIFFEEDLAPIFFSVAKQ